VAPLRPQELAERALSLATCDACIAVATHATAANIRWANSTLSSDGDVSTTHLTVVAVHEGVSGSAIGVISCNGARRADVEHLVRRAEAVARAGAPAGDAEPLLGDRPASPNWDDPLPETSLRTFEPLVPRLADALRSMRSEGLRLSGFASHAVESTFLATSTGLRLRHDDAWGSIEATAAPADRACSVWTATTTRDFAHVDVGELEAALRRRLEWARRRVELPAGRYETLLPPAAVSDLMAYLYASAGARGALDGRTVFSDGDGGTRVGERLSAAPLTLRSDPGDRRLECRDFVASCESSETMSVFDNGLPLRPTSWIESGTLRALVQTRGTAGASALATTPWIGNLILEGTQGERTLDEMIAATDEGLLLTCLWYMREVDSRRLVLTGVTRDGTFLVRNGEVVAAVNNFRYNESPVELLGRVVESGRVEPTIGREWGQYVRTAMAPLRVDGFNMSSVSDAV